MGLLKMNCLLLLLVLGCNNNQELSEVFGEETDQSVNQANNGIDYRQEMRDFVIGLGKHAKEVNPDFKIIPQNGIELVTMNGEPDGKISKDYLALIDGNGQESLFYGHKKDNVKTNQSVSKTLISYLEISQKQDNMIFVTDYCSDLEKVKDSKHKNSSYDFVSFAAPDRDLTIIPELNQTTDKLSGKDIINLNDANNFLFFLNYENYPTKQSVVSAISDSDYDIVFIDMFFNDGTPYSKSMIERLKIKANGSKRLVLAYMSIGEAEDYRFYWNPSWKQEQPEWLDKENKNWPGNFKVKYWEKDWQNIIYGNTDSYLDRIVATGFDGVYLDIIDAFEYFENE